MSIVVEDSGSEKASFLGNGRTIADQRMKENAGQVEHVEAIFAQHVERRRCDTSSSGVSCNPVSGFSRLVLTF